jgi:pimeloyl-ACP methyl ester carboxylesterase
MAAPKTTEGKTILLLHGNGGPHSMAGLAVAFAPQGRVLAPVHPGFAGTPRPADLASILALARHHLAQLETEDLYDVVVIGSSLGGWVASEMVLAAPERFAGLVLIDAVGISVPGAPLDDPAGLAPAELMRRLWHDPVRMTNLMPPPSPEALAEQAANFAAFSAYDNGLAMQDPHLAARLNDLHLRTLVLWGESDGLAPLAYGKAYAAAIPGATFRAVPGAGHLPQVETPAALLAELEPFLDGIKGS